MTFFINPFHKHDPSEFDGVYKPHETSHGRGSVSSAHLSESDDNKTNADKKIDPEKRPSSTSGQTLRDEIQDDLAASGLDSVYDRKSNIVNRAIQDIGMGKYQWELFVLCGFGWLADNLWLQGVALCLPKLTPEFGVDSNTVRYTTCALFVGLCLGASFWGIASDIVGRRLAFNTSLFLTAVFGIAVGGATTWLQTCALFAALGFGIGGNLPVDGALFLEFLPFKSGNLLTMLSVFWPVGQLLGSVIAWGFIPNYSCDSDLLPCSMSQPGEACCLSQDNKGYRYLLYTMGALTMLMWICRFFLFQLYESPKFLLSRGRQTEAVATVYGIAKANKRTTWLNEEILNELGGGSPEAAPSKLSRSEIVRRSLSKFSTQRIAPLFSSRKLGVMTVLIWFCWATIGMGYPLFNAFLPQYLSEAGKGEEAPSTYTTYRNYAITSIVGVPGSIIACYTVDIRHIGRKGTIAFATLITGILLFCFTTSGDSSTQVALSSLEAFFQNIMYGVLYAYTPEVFPAPNRGTGTGIASFFNRVSGLCAPIVAIHAAEANPSAPVFASGALILAAFLAMLFFPIETRGRASL